MRILSILFLLIFILPHKSFACKCANQTLEENFKKHEVVALVDVKKQEFAHSMHIYKLDILKKIKGDPNPADSYLSRGFECGSYPGVGQQILIFANRDEKSPKNWWIASCATLTGKQATNASFKLMVPNTKKDCEKSKGEWVQVRPSLFHCKIQTTDGGKTCKDSSDCQSICVAQLTKEQKAMLSKGPVGLGLEVPGKCSSHTTYPDPCVPLLKIGSIHQMVCE